jgi:hypothetical protein
MPKSSRRRKQDRARVEGKHAEQDRRQAKRRDAELFERATDMALEPAALAALIMGELADSTGTGLIAHTRLQQGAGPAAVAETARLLRAAYPDATPVGSLPPGVLAFIAVAAHASDDEPAEARYTAALVDLCGVAGDEGPLKVAKDVVIWTHPDRAAAMVEPYLLDHPHDYGSYLFWNQAGDQAEELALSERFGPNGPAGTDARRMERNPFGVLAADPGFRARAQHRSEFGSEIRRRSMMPPWQAERLRRAERAERAERGESDT